MNSWRLLLMLLCCIATWSCKSVLGADEFESAKCSEGEKRCTGNQAERCAGGSWQAEKECNGQTCIEGACVGECGPGKRCLGDTPQVCSIEGVWEGDAPCAPGEVCVGGSCNCSTGDLRCFDNNPQRCNESNQWESWGDPCIDQTCDPSAVACLGECAPGQANCLDDVTAQSCSAEGQWLDVECPSGFVCMGGQCEPPNCTSEICDGMDNNCNGLVDEGNPGGGDDCNTGKPGVCKAGTVYCANGGLACKQNLSAQPEVCDGLDNDCNGLIDENNPGSGDPCAVPGATGECAQGMRNCVAGLIVCTQNFVAQPEVCDGLDNDCNGFVDDDLVTTFYQDLDGDGHCDLASFSSGCIQPSGYLPAGCPSDCKDSNSFATTSCSYTFNKLNEPWTKVWNSGCATQVWTVCGAGFHVLSCIAAKVSGSAIISVDSFRGSTCTLKACDQLVEDTTLYPHGICLAD